MTRKSSLCFSGWIIFSCQKQQLNTVNNWSYVQFDNHHEINWKNHASCYWLPTHWVIHPLFLVHLCLKIRLNLCQESWKFVQVYSIHLYLLSDQQTEMSKIMSKDLPLQITWVIIWFLLHFIYIWILLFLIYYFIRSIYVARVFQQMVCHQLLISDILW